MSVALQRITVRMLYDPPFADRIYAGFCPPEIRADQHRMLLSVDRRAWATDPHRRARALTALLEETPASAALIGVSRLDAFFSSPAFHAAIQERRGLASTFARWLQPLAGPVASLELAVIEARRDPPPGPAPGQIVRAAGCRVLSVPEGTLALYLEVRERLGADPLGALARGLYLGPPPALAGEERLLVECDAAGNAQISEIPEALAGLLGAAPASRETLLARARELGADPGDDAEILNGLLADGLLVAG